MQPSDLATYILIDIYLTVCSNVYNYIRKEKTKTVTD